MAIIDERRRWQRLPLRIPVFVQATSDVPPAPMEFAAALNISAGGALLRTRTFIPVDSIINIRVPLSPALGREHHEQQLQAKVLRLEPFDRGFNLAVEFAQTLITGAENAHGASTGGISPG
jgi:PilZ domain-containing protein